MNLPIDLWTDSQLFHLLIDPLSASPTSRFQTTAAHTEHTHANTDKHSFACMQIQRADAPALICYSDVPAFFFFFGQAATMNEQLQKL